MKNVKIKKSYVFLSFVVVFLMAAIILDPQNSMKSMLDGLLVWLNSVLPALFPFLFLTKLLTNLNMAQLLAKKFEKITKKLFNVSGICSYVFLMSLLSGYPIGAKLTAELFNSGKITHAEAVRMNSFCSTSGPLFVVGTVGISLFADKLLGFVILISHILGAVVNGICFRNIKKNENFFVKTASKQTKNFDSVLADTMYDSIISILLIGGFVSLFFVFVDILFQLHILEIISDTIGMILNLFGINPNFSEGLTSGFFEVTRGCKDLASLHENKILLAIFASMLISFGGLSIHLQSFAFLQKCKTKIGLYFLMKTTQSVFSGIIAFLISLLIF